MTYYTYTFKYKDNNEVIARYFYNTATEVLMNEEDKTSFSEIMKYFKQECLKDFANRFTLDKSRRVTIKGGIFDFKVINRTNQTAIPFKAIEPPKGNSMSFSGNDANPNPKGWASFP